MLRYLHLCACKSAARAHLLYDRQGHLPGVRVLLVTELVKHLP